MANSHFGFVASTSATRPTSSPTQVASGAISQDNSAFRNRRTVALGMFKKVNGPKFQRSSLFGMAWRINPPSKPAADDAGIEIGRASCRERVEMPGAKVAVKETKSRNSSAKLQT